MNRYWTSDLHFGHANIIRYSGRPYADVDQMNEQIVENWNSVVSPNDEVMVLGDVALGDFAKSIEYVRRLNGHKMLVPGNHDRVFSRDRRRERFIPIYEGVGFEILDEQFSMVVGDGLVNVCHFPYEGDSHDHDRYADLRPVDDGFPLIHGHVHEKWKINGRMINVGADVWGYTPVHEDVIVDWLRHLSG